MINSNKIINLKEHVKLFQEKKYKVVELWIEQDLFLNILREKDIEVHIFKNPYAIGVMEYFIGIIQGVNELGNCPVIKKMLVMFADHHITSKEVYLICSQFKKSLISFSFDENIASRNLIDSINCILDQNFAGIIQIYDDILNEQSQMTTHHEQKLKEYNKAIDASVLVSKSNTKGIITYANQAFLEVSGYSLDELIGNSHNIVRHSDTQDEMYHDMWKTIRSKKVWRGMLKNKTKDGDDYYVDVTIVPILNSKNKICEFLSIRHEVTNLVVATQKAQESQMAKEQFLANMSHELLTPLNAILGFSQIIMARADTPEQTSNYVSKINIAGRNLLTQVNTILDLSKIESGQMQYKFETFQLKPLFEELRVILESQAKDKNISLIVSMLDKEEMYGDKLSIKQVFMNLLSNAIKFTAINTTVEISYTYNIKQKEHIFKVYDQGNGVDEKDIQTLFEPFYQGENSRINATPGTGLGLAICKKIVTDVHKGKIGVENIKNGGSCFYMTIPVNA